MCFSASSARWNRLISFSTTIRTRLWSCRDPYNRAHGNAFIGGAHEPGWNEPSRLLWKAKITGAFSVKRALNTFLHPVECLSGNIQSIKSTTLTPDARTCSAQPRGAAGLDGWNIPHAQQLHPAPASSWCKLPCGRAAESNAQSSPFPPLSCAACRT